MRIFGQSMPDWVSTGEVAIGLVALAEIVQIVGQFLFDPCVDGPPLASTTFAYHCWLVRPCVRPVGAAHSAAGRNAIRASRVPITFTRLMRLGHCGFSRSGGSTGLLH